MAIRTRTRSVTARRGRPAELGRLVESAVTIGRALPQSRSAGGRQRLRRALQKSAARPQLASELKEIRRAVELLSKTAGIRKAVAGPVKSLLPGSPVEPVAAVKGRDPFRITSLEEIRVDLSDVLGTPLFPGGADLAERVSGAFRGEFRQAADLSEPFLFGLAAEPLAGGPEAQVSSFVGRLDRVLPKSTLQPRDVRILAARSSTTGSHLLVQQTVRGAEVVGARFKLHVGKDGRPFGLTGRPLGDLSARDPGDPPRLSDVEAREAVRSALRIASNVTVDVKSVVFPVSGACVWAWEARYVSYKPAVADVRAYLRADDLSLLVRFNVASATLRGEANVFPVNPLRTPKLAAVRLDDIGPDPKDALAGSRVVVQPRRGTPIRKATRDFRLAPEQPGFDEAHAYYHLCRALAFFEGLLDRSLLQAAPFAPVRATVRDARSPANAYFLPSTGELLFGDFGSRPSARSADIIGHELGHAVSDTICRLGRGLQDSPARGMSEGFSDYFQASALGDPRIGDYVTGKAAGHRNLSTPGLKFSKVLSGEEHATGEVWGAVLWALRERLGAGVADLIAVESLQFLDAFASFDQGLAALLQADARLFSAGPRAGRHAEAIQEEFDLRR